MLQMGRHRREVLQRLQRLFAPLGVARAQRRSEDLLEQVRLTVGRGAKDTQVAPTDAVARELGHRADDLALGLVEVAYAAALLALDDAVLFELAHELRVGLRLLQHVIERIQRPGRLAHADARAPRAHPVAGGTGPARVSIERGLPRAPSRQL